jgi:phosphoglycerate dehydrogenase-like enzyme
MRLLPLEAALEAADFVSLHVPATPETRGLVGEEQIRAMRRGAFLVNTGRGDVVDEAALARALAGGHLGGAALDVRAEEPGEAGPLASCEDAVLTPHIGAFTREAQARVIATVCADLRAVLYGRPARHAVNFDRPRRRAA